jgi:hypothetical protein
MVATESFGDEHLYRLPYQLGPRVTKHLLGPGIDDDNLAGPVDHHDAVRRTLDD